MSGHPSDRVPEKAACKDGAVRCGNCSIWVSPVWRYQKTLRMLLCNACSCCYASKGVHRAKPSQEGLEKIAEAFAAKQSKLAPRFAPTRPLTQGSSDEGSQETEVQLGKRKRQPKAWGADVLTYEEDDKGGHEDEKTDFDIRATDDGEVDVLSKWANQPAVINARTAAGILVRMKTSEGHSTKRARVINEEEHLPRLQMQNSTNLDCTVHLTVTPKPTSQNIKKSVKIDRCCARCGTTETPTWRKAGGNVDLCNACGVRKATKRRGRNHPVPAHKALTRAASGTSHSTSRPGTLEPQKIAMPSTDVHLTPPIGMSQDSDTTYVPLDVQNVDPRPFASVAVLDAQRLNISAYQNFPNTTMRVASYMPDANAASNFAAHDFLGAARMSPFQAPVHRALDDSARTTQRSLFHKVAASQNHQTEDSKVFPSQGNWSKGPMNVHPIMSALHI